MSKPREWRKIEEKWLEDPDFRSAYAQEFPFDEVSQAIIELRLRHSLTQEMLASKLGRCQSYVARLESGKSNVSFRVLQEIARAAGEELWVSFQQAAVGEFSAVPAKGSGQRPA